MFKTTLYKPIPVFPFVSRDIAIIVPDCVRHEQILNLIKRVGPSELTDIELFDIFTGKGIGESEKSLAYSLIYRSPERTLTDQEVNKFNDDIVKALGKELKARLRE